MLLTSRVNLSVAALAGAFLALAAGSQAQSLPPGAGVNLLADPGFTSQPPTFQSSGGPYAAGWTYTPGFDIFSGSWDLVSQSLPTTDLYYYGISFNLGTTSAEGGVDFSVLWDGSSIALDTLPASDAWTQYTFIVTASGPSSVVGLVGNSQFWSSLSGLDVSWTGGIDPPPVPDSPIGFTLEAAVLLGLCGLAGFFRPPALRLAPCRAD